MLPNAERRSAQQRLLQDKPEIPCREVEACLGDPSAGFSVAATGYDFEYRTCRNQFEIRRAADCDLVYVFPQPCAEALATIYPPEYIPFQFHQHRGPARWARDFVQGRKAKAILRLAGETGKILDVGTGSGILLRQIARVKGSTNDLYANDFSDSMLAPLRNEGFQTLFGPAENLVTPERFAVICMNQVLEHLQNPVTVINCLSKLLAPGGYLFIETPNIASLDARIFGARFWGGYHIPRHFWLFSETSLRHLLTAAGLCVTGVRYLASPAFWIQSVHHWLLDRGWFNTARFFSEKNPVLLAPATILDLLTRALGGKTSNIRIIAQKQPESQSQPFDLDRYPTIKLFNPNSNV
jgi:2-polyprenyl-3-methyl-5-hydroxy-6-metoxy-1,4-benzoquinol methylase